MVRVKSSGLATYPDVNVVCGPLETNPQSPNTVTNPIVLVEVLRDSTAAYDRGEKLEEYKSITSLQAVLLVSQTSRRIEVHQRGERGFNTTVLTTGQSLSLESIGAKLDLDSTYQDAGL